MMPWTDEEAREYLALQMRLRAIERAGIDYSQYADNAEGFIEEKWEPFDTLGLDQLAGLQPLCLQLGPRCNLGQLGFLGAFDFQRANVVLHGLPTIVLSVAAITGDAWLKSLGVR